MLFDLFGFKSLKALINRNQGVVMSALDNLKREVAESTAQNAVLLEVVKNLRSDVQTARDQLQEAIANGANATDLQALADQLDANQKAAQEALDQNGVGQPSTPPTEPAPTEPEQPAEPTEPTTPTEPEAPAEPVTEPATPVEQPTTPTEPADETGKPLV